MTFWGYYCGKSSYKKISYNIWRNYFPDYKIHENAKKKIDFLSEEIKLK